MTAVEAFNELAGGEFDLWLEQRRLYRQLVAAGDTAACPNGRPSARGRPGVRPGRGSSGGTSARFSRSDDAHQDRPGFERASAKPGRYPSQMHKTSGCLSN